MPCSCIDLDCSCETSPIAETSVTCTCTDTCRSCPYSYDLLSDLGPLQWNKYYPHCEGCKQSPIAISIYASSKVSGHLKFDNLKKQPSVCVIKNTGHTIMVSFCWLKNEPIPPTVTGGPLKDVLYYFQHLTFHWGDTNSVGSEHTLNGKKYPLEMQLVFYNSHYENYEIAQENPKGLAILSFLCAIEHNPPRSPIKDYLRFLIFPDNRITIDEELIFTLNDIVKNFRWNFFSYCGSTTTPPCYENVQWILSNYVMPIEEDLLIKLRKLRNNRLMKLVNNYRPLQNLNDRSVCFYIC